MTNAQETFTIATILKTAFEKTQGAKITLWAAIGVTILIITSLRALVHLLSSSLLGLITHMIFVLLQVGILYLAILRTKNQTIVYTQIFEALRWETAIHLIGIYLTQTFCYVLASFIFFISPTILYGHRTQAILHAGLSSHSAFISLLFVLGILSIFFIFIRTMFAVSFAIDQKVGTWRALCLSFQVTRHYTFKLFGVICCQIITLIVGACLFGIGLIWAIPMIFMIYAVTYCTLARTSGVIAHLTRVE